MALQEGQLVKMDRLPTREEDTSGYFHLTNKSATANDFLGHLGRIEQIFGDGDILVRFQINGRPRGKWIPSTVLIAVSEGVVEKAAFEEMMR